MWILINECVLIFLSFLVHGNDGVERCPLGSYTQRYKDSCRSVPVFNDSCIVPNLPPHTEYNQSDIVVGPGIKVPPLTHLQINCPQDYKLVGNNEIICLNKTWSSTLGQCIKTCPSIHSSQELHVTCFYENRKLPNCDKPIEGTIVKYECSHFYDYMQISKHAVQICRGGSWSYPRPKCVPICGQKFVDAQPLIVNGTTAKKIEFPWQVAIYRGEEKKFICGGILINQRVVLTAASCIKPEEQQVPKELFTVAVGKHYRNYSESEEDAQFSTLDEIFLPPEYNGYLQYYFADIALLVTTKSFILSRKVLPICVDWNQDYNEQLYKSQEAYITGWGFINSNNVLADELQELQVPIISTEKCTAELPDNFYFTPDKFCAGYVDKSGRKANRGDLGGGLVVQHNGRYYVTGILSLCPRNEVSSSCDDHYGLYTNISSHLNFILNKTNNVTILETEIPNFFENATITQKSAIAENCPNITTTAATEASCIVTDNRISSCLNSKDGTVALFKCAPLYENVQNEPFTICKNGAWDRKPPVCSPACGIVPIQAKTLIVGGNDTEKGSFPWQAAIYRSEEGNHKKFICGATMIRQKVFLTAAHCITYENNYSLQPINWFTIAVGKHYRKFNDSRDTHAQFSAIKTMFLPSQYQGYTQNYYGDIAILITEKEFELSTYVRPVCVDWNGNFQLEPFLDGIVAGWGSTKESGDLADQLKVLKVPYISKEMCKAELNSDYLPYLTFDKMCSGYLDQSKSACQGDSGSGLVFRNQDDGKYYIMGIVSVAPQAPTGGCNSQKYTLYTEVSFYVNSFIITKIPN